MKIVKGIAALGAVILFGVIAYFAYNLFRVRSLPERLADIIHIEDTREFTDRLEDYLSDDSAQVRARAAIAIGRIGGENSGKLLKSMLGDRSLDVARAAAFAIGLTGQSQFAGSLADSARSGPTAVAANALKSAGRRADSSMTAVHGVIAGYLG
ncbi:MAG: HEAT repeat domain-containing protein, partial [Candidatus Zixiibacteriota bacterium]